MATSKPIAGVLEYDVIVVGAGVEGSSTAYNLVKNGGGRVLLLEQFSALHTRGSSHGGSRITRRAYHEPYYVRMMDEAFKIWNQIEKESKTQLYINTGILLFGPKESVDLNKTICSLSTNGVQHEVLTAEEAMSRYPHQLKLPSDHKCVFEKDGGILLATKAVGAIQRLFIKFGGELLDHHCVTEFIPGDIVTVRTDKGDFRTKKVVITAGPWAPQILDKLGLKLPFEVRRAEVFYWKVDHPEHFSSKSFPTFGFYTLSENICPFYGIPIYEYPGLVKICSHGFLSVDPDNRDSKPEPSVEDVQAFVRKYFKGVSTSPSIYEPCLYTKTLDENPIIDRHPVYSNIVFGAGFSGHGFKLGPVVGKLLSELALDRPSSHDLSPFKLDRFNKTPYSAKL